MSADVRPADTVSRETYDAAVNRIDRLENVLRQINAIEDVPHVENKIKVGLMGALARSMLT